MNKNTGKEKESNNEISRRKFIQGTTAGVALMAGGALLSSAPGVVSAQSKSGAGFPATAPVGAQATSGSAQSSVPTNWSKTADVVVVGYGGAGAVAAITAYDAGASVLVLEKSPSLASLGVTGTTPTYSISGGGGNTHISGGACVWPQDPVGAALLLYYIGAEGATPYDVCEAWASVGTGNKAWFDKVGIKYTVSTSVSSWPNAPGGGSIIGLSATGSGAAMFKSMDQAVQSRGIPILFNAPATDLIQNPVTKEILGVKALANNSMVLNIRANRGVILCTGGFEFDEAMLASYTRVYPQHPNGWQYNTGDGIRMAQKVGAGMWHMFGGPSTKGAWFPQYAASFSTSVKNNAWIWVNKYGQRFMNESAYTAENFEYVLTDYNISGTNPPATTSTGSTVPEYTRVPFFMVFDSTGFKAGALGSGAYTTSGSGIPILPPQVGGKPAWSADNSVELAAGWIITGATSITDLANAINSAKIATSAWANAQRIVISISPSVLTATVNQWNTDCAAGKGDTVFGRAASAMLPISTPPYYAIAQWASKYNTTGGPIRNAKAQVCDPDNNPIPRLYSAGELGSVLSINYLRGGCDISECVAFGQIAGNNAAAEVLWTS
jgi:hypothetical protein